jgi:ankyrin repeat protein
MFYQEGSTPLMLACQEGHLEVATVLIENGADLNAKDDVNYFDDIYFLCSNLIF